MTYLVTGAAGFIGFHTCKALLDAGHEVVGIDNFNDYYNPQLKKDRIKQIQEEKNFTIHALDFAEAKQLEALKKYKFKKIIHLGAQAGVRYSLENPAAYVRSNLVGHANIMELARHSDTLEHMVYASSSSVYGGNTDLPFAVSDRVDKPISLYAATKRSDELMSYSYAHLYGLPLTGLRFFTVYGPWGRPDMALWIFCEKIVKGEPIPVFNKGKMQRDFTFVSDIVKGVLAAANKVPDASSGPPHKIYNLGNNQSEPLMDVISTLESAIGIEAKKNWLPMQPGDVPATYADIEASRKDLGFEPSVDIRKGVPLFVDWFLKYNKV